MPTLSAERAGHQKLALIRAHDQLAFFIPQRAAAAGVRHQHRNGIFMREALQVTDGLPPAIIPHRLAAGNKRCPGIEIGRIGMCIKDAKVFIPRHQARSAPLRIAQNAMASGRKQHKAFLALAILFQGEPGNNGNLV